MTSMREKDQADFDLERFIDMFDEALTSRDPRVINALRSLMMIVTLTKPETSIGLAADREQGPLKRLFDDVRNLNRRLSRTEENIQIILNNVRGESNRDGYYPNERHEEHLAKQTASQVMMSYNAVNKVQGIK